MPEAMELDAEKISAELKIRPEIYLKIVKSFSNTLTEKVEQIRQAIQEENSDRLRQVLHEVKGTASNLRLNNISQAENLLHVAVKAGDSKETLEAFFVKLKEESEKLTVYARSLL